MELVELLNCKIHWANIQSKKSIINLFLENVVYGYSSTLFVLLR